MSVFFHEEDLPGGVLGPVSSTGGCDSPDSSVGTIQFLQRMVAEKPPLIVLIHGGPTAAARPMLQVGTQYWTSRGFAVVDVNYGGSTGYGREYRLRVRAVVRAANAGGARAAGSGRSRPPPATVQPVGRRLPPRHIHAGHRRFHFCTSWRRWSGHPRAGC